MNSTFTWDELDAKAVDTARVLAADAVEKVVGVADRAASRAAARM